MGQDDKENKGSKGNKKVEGNKEITYHNKDVFSKILAENFKDKSLKVYGIDIPRITSVLPTNLPAVQVNELRLDNLFQLEDGSLAIIDYESTIKKENYVKYLRYVVRIVERYQNQGNEELMSISANNIRMIVIYTADIESAPSEYSVGCVTLKIEQAFLSKLNSSDIVRRITEKIQNKRELTEEEMMELIILPLTYKGADKKKAAVRETIELAKKIQKQETKTFVLAGILVFADKIMDSITANQVKEALKMTQVAELLLEEGMEKGREYEIVEKIMIKLGKGLSDTTIAEHLELSSKEELEILEYCRNHTTKTVDEIVHDIILKAN